ncbi:hypothetical protein Pcinc_001133 [Petrolisthes cinctipes]|uniref:Endonuclease-reverse transcriptase n=1 Tax=Petrolisthes cinctipes TaxID=88211 RepID=A0AAE1L471_PETCI|nr:hypothetical protein Pcinc_001133 [Petrolisthes cinctipes]
MQPTSLRLPVSSLEPRWKRCGQREAPRKGGVNIGHGKLVWSAYRGWRTSHHCGRNNRNLTKNLTLGAWNICTLQDVADINRPERRTALVCKELARFNIDVAALSETRLPEEGNIREAGTGYAIFWKGKAHEEPRIHGVGFAIRSQLVQQHNLAPTAINERLMTSQRQKRYPHHPIHARGGRLLDGPQTPDLPTADDNATPGQTAEDLQRTATTYNTIYERFGMQVNTDKTKALIQHPPGQILPNINTTINEHTLEEVEQFSYLGSILTSTPTCKKDVENRIRAAHSAYGRLSCRVFNNHALTMATKIMVFQAIVLSTLLYACETWTLYRSDIQSLERFQQYKLRQILKIPWESHTTNVAVLNQASVTSVEATIIHHRLRWAGHVQRMEPFRLPIIMLYGELANGTRPRGAPKLRYKDQLKRTLALTKIDPSSWEQTARDRATWRRAVHHGTTAFEEIRKENEEAKRRRRE